MFKSKKIKQIISMVFFCSFLQMANAQKGTTNKGFKKENMFTGGNITASLFTGGAVLGANPHLGYSITDWLDAAININYTYTGYRNEFSDKFRQHVYGPGAFVRVFPIPFAFLQAHYEYNFINLKVLPSGGGQNKINEQAGSVLLGAGYAQGRVAGDNNFFYISLLYDVTQSPNSPYVDRSGRSIPIFNFGFNIALNQGDGRRRK